VEARGFSCAQCHFRCVHVSCGLRVHLDISLPVLLCVNERLRVHAPWRSRKIEVTLWICMMNSCLSPPKAGQA
jgi:hypothetical protein